MKDLFRIISHRFQKNKKQSVSVLAIIITFVMVYSLIMPAVAIERDAAEKEPGMTVEGTASENVTAEAMAEGEPASLEAEVTEEAAVEEPVAEEAAVEEPVAEEIQTESAAPAAAPAENNAADDSNVAAETSAAQQGANTGAAQENTGASQANTGAAAQADANQANADSKADSSASDTKTSDAEEGMPAQNFEQVIKYKEIIDEDGNTVDKEIKVVVDAAKDTFPAGTTMKAELILDNADVEKAVEAAVKQAAGELADATSIVQYRAVDITFADKDGQKVEPAKKVEVRITSDKIAEIVNPMLVHVNVNDQNGRVINADVFPKKDVSIIDEKPDTIDDNENTMLFKASRFSPYVIVESQTIDEEGDAMHGLNGVEENADNGAEAADNKSGNAASADGDGVLIAESDSYTVTIKYDENANIPEDAEIDIKEIPEASRQYQSYMGEAEKLLIGDANENGENASGSKEINYAKIVDVNIVSATEGTVTPEADIDVDIAYKETEEIAEGTVMQALSFNGRTPEVEKDALVYGGETYVDGLQVTTDKLPVYGIVGTELKTEVTLPGSDDTYEVSVTYGSEAKIPEGATLDVKALAADSEEYKAAKEAVVAAKKDADAEFDEKDLGFAALDITIKDAQGNPVEPAEGAEVKVSFKMKKLPTTATEEALADTLEIQHLNEATGTTQVETVAQVQDVTVADGAAKAEFSLTSFSTFTLTWDQESATIHWMDFATGEELDESLVATLDLSGNSISLANTFAGYTYMNTTYHSSEDSQAMRPYIYKTDTGWEVVTVEKNEQTGVETETRETLGNGSDIYVYYAQNAGHGESPDTVEGPTTIKSITDDDNDGVKSIQLDVSAPTKTETDVQGANVLLVVDTTYSMAFSMEGSDNRMEAARTAITTLIDTLETDKNTINLSLVEFNRTGVTTYGYTNTNGWTNNRNNELSNYVSDEDSFNHVSNDSHGTNWEAGLYQALTPLGTRDTKNNTYVIFLTDGEPNGWGRTSYSNTRTGREGSGPWARSYYDAENGVRYYSAAEKAVAQAINEAQSITSTANTSLYAVYCGDDEDGANRLSGLITTAGGVRTIAATNKTALENEFKSIAHTIVSNLGSSNVSVDDGITELSSVRANVTGTAGGYEYYISYKLTVNGTTGTYKDSTGEHTVQMSDPNVWSREEDVKNTDGTTTKTTAYYYRMEWTDHPGASFSDDNGVTWDLSAAGVLQPDVVYSVKFDVWPSQAAYDLIANLDNETVKVNDLTADEKEQLEITVGGTVYEYKNGAWSPSISDEELEALIDAALRTNPPSVSYNLKTNTHLNTTYTYNGNTYTDKFDQGHGLMEIESTEMDVRKAFADTINSEDPFTSIVFYLKTTDPADQGTSKEGTYYYYQTDGSLSETLVTEGTVKAFELPVNTNNNWTNSIYIAPGVIQDGQVLETGHKYTLEEKILAGSEYEYEFTPQVVRPMEIDGTLTYLVLIDEYNAPGKNNVPADAQTYTIDGENYYVASTNDGELVGTNRKTAELDITKIVETNGLLSDEEEENESFTYRVTLQIPDNNNIDPAGIVGFEYVNRTQANAFYAYGYHQYTQEEWEAAGRTGTPPVVDAYSEDVERLGNNTYRRWQYLIYRDLLADNGYEVVNGKVKLVKDSNGNIQWRNAAVDGYHTVTYDMTLKQSELIRFTNLPTGTKYTIQEIYANKYPADNSGNSSGLTPSADASNIAEEGYAITVKSTGGTVSRTAVANDTVSGEINGLDTRFYNQFTNTMTKTVDVNLAGTKKLSGYDWTGENYHFTLATTGSNPMPPAATGKTEFDLTAESGNADQTDTFGRLRFTAPGTYTYTVSETYAGTLQIVNNKAVQFGDAVTVTIEIEEDETTHELSVKNVTGAEWNPETKTATASITNTAPITQVSASKVWQNADGTTTAPANAKVTFTLYADGDPVSPAKTVELDGQVDQNGEAEAWKATFSGLQQYKIVEGETAPVAINYTVGETGTWTGYELVTTPPVSNGGTITNKQMVQKVQFIKEDATDTNTKLPGAVFTFSIGNTEYTVTSDADGLMKTTNGTFVFELPVSSTPYEMTETSAPAGYNKMTGKVLVTSSENGISAGRSDDSVVTYNVDEPTTDNPNYVVHITNSSGVELPMTGGSGTLPYTLGGLALMMASALMYGFRMRRRERRLN